MRRARVESSLLESVGYDPATETLEIAFQDGRIYQYFKVEPEIYQELLAAPSLGRYFNATIRDYPYRRLQ